ncbi:ALOX5 [Mytilus coruscus]|uniref:ALOX5 n=1 Tax=Mytilus coruscus TaxID=42192 RepID=A0A6J8ANL8_MYTCO|nr:ALOX5 [Mytilus coruscus]
MGRISYIILVKTGDKKLSGTDSNVSIILHGYIGIKTEELVLDNFFRNDFEAGTIDSFSIESDVNIPQIERIELWRDTLGVSSSWYVDWIEVKNQTTAESSIFPVFRWIKENFHYCIQHLDTSLSQYDKYPNQRYMELSEKRNAYQLTVKIENGPAQVHD